MLFFFVMNKMHNYKIFIIDEDIKSRKSLKFVEKIIFHTLALTEKNYWADNSYCSDLEVTIYGQ